MLIDCVLFYFYNLSTDIILVGTDPSSDYQGSTKAKIIITIGKPEAGLKKYNELLPYHEERKNRRAVEDHYFDVVACVSIRTTVRNK